MYEAMDQGGGGFGLPTIHIIGYNFHQRTGGEGTHSTYHT